MSDPFSVSAGVVGVVSLGLTICQGLASYYGPWNAYDEEISDFTAKIEGLQTILEMLSGFIAEIKDLNSLPDQYLKLVLEKSLAKFDSSDSFPLIKKHDWLRWKRATYPFKKDTLVALSQTISGLQDNLALTLQLLNSAFLAQQQQQLQEVASKATCIDVRTAKILEIVEASSTSSQALVHRIGSIDDIWRQQELINIGRHKAMRLTTSQADLISRYCTCNTETSRSSVFTFSAFVAHKVLCPMYVPGQKTIAIAARYAFCNHLLGLSVDFMMTLTQGVGQLSIYRTVRFHSVVSSHSPAFKLMRRVMTLIWAERPEELLRETQEQILQMLRDKKVNPTDCLRDGSTLLHVLAHNVAVWYGSTPGSFGIVRGFVCALIEAGVPVNEKDLRGITAIDRFISYLPSVERSRPPYSTIGLDLLQCLLRSGGCLKSLDRQANTQPRKRVRGQNSKARLRVKLTSAPTSEEGLRHCLSKINNYKHTPLPTFSTLLIEALGWVPGMLLLLESALPQEPDAIADCCLQACKNNEHDSALLLLGYRPTLSLNNLESTVDCVNIDVLRTTISLLASQRHRLEELARHHLPTQTLHALKLPLRGLLDSAAGKVYDALTKAGLEVQPEPDTGYFQHPGDSVYSAIRNDITAAGLLYDAGFTHLQQRGKNGTVPLAELQLLRPALYGPFADLLNWMIHRGASLYQPSLGGYPAIFGVAEAFGSGFSWYRSSSPSARDEFRLSLESMTGDAGQLLATLFSDEALDDCQCACSDTGCSPWTRFLKKCLSIPTQIIPELQGRIHEVCGVEFPKSNSLDIVRHATFGELGLTHTCHAKEDGRVSWMDPEDIHEVHDEESDLIDQLNHLMVEFEEKYHELGVGLEQFFLDYWQDRMDEIYFADDGAQEHVRQVQELGVILSDRAEDVDEDSDDTLLF
ncbi:hypothetical protein BJX99DRAFT_270829 [Aspergillus californicus]